MITLVVGDCSLTDVRTAGLSIRLEAADESVVTERIASNKAYLR